MDTGEEDDADKRKVEFKAQTSPCKIEALKPRDDRVPTREVEAVTVAKVTERGCCGNPATWRRHKLQSKYLEGDGTGRC